MNFWKRKDKSNESDQTKSKSNVLNGLNQRSAYFERCIKEDALFIPEYEVSKTINLILNEKEILTERKVTEILTLLNDIEKVEHYDGSGWYDYQIQLAHFLRLNGFDTEFKDRKLYLIEHL